MAHWIELHATGLRQELRPARHTMPSESTLRRVLREVDPVRLEKGLAAYTACRVAEQPGPGQR